MHQHEHTDKPTHAASTDEPGKAERPPKSSHMSTTTNRAPKGHTYDPGPGRWGTTPRLGAVHPRGAGRVCRRRGAPGGSTLTSPSPPNFQSPEHAAHGRENVPVLARTRRVHGDLVVPPIPHPPSSVVIIGLKSNHWTKKVRLKSIRKICVNSKFPVGPITGRGICG